MNSCLQNIDPMALATAYGQKPKVVRAKQSAMVEGENCTYGPTLQNWLNVKCFSKDEKLVLKSSLFCIAIANIIHRVPIFKFKKIIYFWNPRIKITFGLIKCPCLSVHSFAIDGICGVYSLIRAKVDGFFTIMALFSF